MARALKSKAMAAGTLELLWAAANDSGDALIGTAADVEEIADWRGKPGALALLLAEIGFLDDTERGFVVHDHEHHCPQYVRRRREREQRRRATDAPVTSQHRATDKPVSSTPNSHHPSPNKKEIQKAEDCGVPTPPPPASSTSTLIPRMNPRIVNPGGIVACWDWMFRDLLVMAAPIWLDETQRRDELRRWLGKVDDALRAAKTLPAEDGKTFWPARFRAEFGSQAAAVDDEAAAAQRIAKDLEARRAKRAGVGA